MNIFYEFYWRFIKRVPAMPYTPELIGVRPLENGRLGLAFWDKKEQWEEYRVINIWEVFKDRKEDPVIKPLFDPDVFSEVCFYQWQAQWPNWYDISATELYSLSHDIPENFLCLN